MAVCKMLMFGQISLLNISAKCWNFQQRSISKTKIIKELLDFDKKPKKPINPYIRYILAQKEEFSSKYSGKSFKDVLKLLSVQWSELPESEKEKYYKEYEEEKKIYYAKIKEFENSLLNTEKKELVQLVTDLKEVKTPQASSLVKNILTKSFNKPKPPFTIFFKYYINLEKKGGGEFAKEVSKQWKLLPEEEKKKYKEEYDREYAQYRKDLEKWEKEMISAGFVEVVRSKTLKEMLQKTS